MFQALQNFSFFYDHEHLQDLPLKFQQSTGFMNETFWWWSSQSCQHQIIASFWYYYCPNLLSIRFSLLNSYSQATAVTGNTNKIQINFPKIQNSLYWSELYRKAYLRTTHSVLLFKSLNISTIQAAIVLTSFTSLKIKYYSQVSVFRYLKYSCFPQNDRLCCSTAKTNIIIFLGKSA